MRVVGGLAAVVLLGCAHVDPGTEPGGSGTEPGVVVEAEPAATNEPPPAPSLTGEDAFVAVYAALREGDWAAFERFAGAAQIRVIRTSSLGEEPPEVETIAGADAQAWVAALARTWAPSCAEQPDPPCRSLNPLTLGVEDDELEMRCADADAGSLGSVCCRHRPPLLHNTPFLVGVCFDDSGRVTQVELLDG